MSDLALQQTSGGQKIAVVALGSGTADVVVSTLPGRINKVLVTASATSAALELYDHASASSGAKLLWKSSTSATAGDVITLDIPVTNGIVAKQVSNSAGVTISYTEDGSSDAIADKSELVTTGGQFTSYHAAAGSGAGAALAAPGRLCKVVVLTSGSAVTHIYDNASAASGNKLFTLKASPTIGDVYDIQVPASAGIYVGGTTNTSSLLVTYTTNTVRNR